MTNKTLVRDIIEQSENKNPTAVTEAFRKAISQKLSQVLDEKKKNIAENIFEAKTKKETVEFDDEDKDIENDSSVRNRNMKVKFTNDLEDEDEDDEDNEDENMETENSHRKGKK